MYGYSSTPGPISGKGQKVQVLSFRVEKSESPRSGKKTSPWRLRIKTFREFTFIIYSRRLRVRLLG
jgi:hypothetical protein